MKWEKKFWIMIITIGVFFPFIANAQDTLVAKLGKGFTSNIANMDSTTIHYVHGGNGPTVVLLHGYPMDWYVYHKVIPLLAKNFTVIALDLRGVGRSSATTKRYDAMSLAGDVHQLIQQLKIKQVYIVGHDIGGMATYAFARLYPKETRGVMILDVPLPGIDPWEESISGPDFWHIPFHQIPDLPETLVAGHQFPYLRYIFSRKHFTDADVAYYAASYASPEQLHSGFEFYRAFPENGKFFDAQRTPIDVPIVWAAGENSFFGKIGPNIAEGLRAHGCRNVKNEIIKGSEHWPMYEQPAALAELIKRYASLSID